MKINERVIKMLTIVLTPTMITFKNLDEETANKVYDLIGIKWGDKGYFLKGNEQELFKALLTLSYTYDIEIV